MRSIMLALAGMLASSLALAELPAYRMEVIRGDGSVFPKFIDAINNRGDMAGSVKGANPHPHHYTAARLSGETITELPRSHWVHVEGLNDLGDLLGVEAISKPTVWWHDGTREVINHLDWAYAINSQGQVAGTRGDWGVVYDHGAVKVLEPADRNGGTQALDINDSGMVAGHASYVSGGQWVTEPAIWDADGKLKLLGSFGGDVGMAFAINASGHAVGFSSGGGAFFYDGGHLLRVPPADLCNVTGANDVNDHDLVLAYVECGAEFGPLLWQGDQPRYLRDLVADRAADWQTLYAQAVNNAGQIVGWGLYRGKYRSFLATPKGDSE